MANLPLHLTLISANLKGGNLFTKKSVYAIATLNNDPGSKRRTPVDKDGGKSPIWNFHTTFLIPIANPDVLDLHIQLKSKGIPRNSDVGEVHIPISIKELLLEGDAKPVSWTVIKASGKPKGILNISYQIGNEVAPPQQPIIGYPAAVDGSNAYPPPTGAYPPAYGYGAPQPQPGYGYGYPPQPQPGYGYGYPPQPQPGYGYGYPPQAAKPKKNRLWMALRACLLFGDLGGDDFIGEMIYDAGDSGFDDDGGFVREQELEEN